MVGCPNILGLYSTGSKLQLPVILVLEEYKSTKTCQAMMLQNSKDERVCQTGIVVRTGHKWSASRALTEAEDRLQHADIIRTVAQGRLGLGCFTRTSWNKADPKQCHSMVQREVCKAEEETPLISARVACISAMIPSLVVLEDPTPVVPNPVVLEDLTLLVLEDPTPVIPSLAVLEDLTPVVPSPVVLENPTLVVSEVATELPDFTAEP